MLLDKMVVFLNLFFFVQSGSVYQNNRIYAEEILVSIALAMCK